jgi:hypothetical protein
LLSALNAVLKYYHTTIPPLNGPQLQSLSGPQALAEALFNYDDTDGALVAYNAVRQPLSERIVLHSRKLGTQLGVGIETDGDRKLATLLQTPQGIMDWVAMPNFLEMRV